MVWAFVAAVGGMLLYGIASVSQGYAASRASGAAVLRHPAYAAGLACDGLAWLCSLAALAGLPLFVVQSLLAGSLAVTVLLARPLLHVPISRRDGLAVAAVTAGLLLVSASAADESTAAAPTWFPMTIHAGAAVAIAAGALLYTRGGGVALGALGGLSFSVSALGARAAHLGERPLGETLTDPLTWAIVAAGVAGAVLYARSLERGTIGPATAALWVVEVVAPGAIGVAALGDTVRPGWALPALAGIVVAVAACIVLAHSPAQSEGATA